MYLSLKYKWKKKNNFVAFVYLDKGGNSGAG
jgi:hypothetical protein